MDINDIRLGILRTGGTQCDLETKRAIELAAKSLYGDNTFQAEVVRDKKLYQGVKKLDDYHGLVIPGGFSYGDRIRAGAILGITLITEIGGDIKKFVEDGKPVLGICNGFQVLVEAGLLPAFNGISSQPEMALAANIPYGYHCGWMFLKNHSNKCIFTQEINKERVIRIPVANGEGRLIFPVGKENEFHERLKQNDQIVFRYVKTDGSPANGERPYNYNGTSFDIAGISNPYGNVLGMMPHPERASEWWQYPDWTRTGYTGEGDGLEIFKGMLKYIARKF